MAKMRTGGVPSGQMAEKHARGSSFDHRNSKRAGLEFRVYADLLTLSATLKQEPPKGWPPEHRLVSPRMLRTISPPPRSRPRTQSRPASPRIPAAPQEWHARARHSDGS